MEETQLTASKKFSNMLVPAFEGHFGIAPTENEVALMTSYYFGIEKTIINSDGYYKMADLDAVQLKRDLIHFSRLGYDCNVPDMLSFMPRKDGKTGKVKMLPIEGKAGLIYKADKFCNEEDKPIDYKVELVYEKDEFTMIKSDAENEGDSYKFKITSPFNRGNLVGGFGYLVYKDKSKNKLLVMSIEEILRYKPDKASEKFWGKWKEKMCIKTITKQLFKLVKLNPEKLSMYAESLNVIDNTDMEFAKLEAQEEVEANANVGEVIDIDLDIEEVVDVEVEELKEVE